MWRVAVATAAVGVSGRAKGSLLCRSVIYFGIFATDVARFPLVAVAVLVFPVVVVVVVAAAAAAFVVIIIIVSFAFLLPLSSYSSFASLRAR